MNTTPLGRRLPTCPTVSGLHQYDAHCELGKKVLNCKDKTMTDHVAHSPNEDGANEYGQLQRRLSTGHFDDFWPIHFTQSILVLSFWFFFFSYSTQHRLLAEPKFEEVPSTEYKPHKRVWSLAKVVKNPWASTNGPLIVKVLEIRQRFLIVLNCE